jgi:hypothetical protein
MCLRPSGNEPNLLGVLIVDGLLWGEVALHGRHLVELLGPGDFVQIPTTDGPAWPAGDSTRLIAADKTRLVVVGEPFVRAAGRWPSLLSSVGRRLQA